MTVNAHIAREAWTHKVPIALFVGGSVLLFIHLANLLIVPVPTIMQPPLGLALGFLYLLVGAAYEWIIQKQKEMEERHEHQKEMLRQSGELVDGNKSN
ncbi:hypothetical protein HLRTI_000434 [Halorhabdus tiamatea SARL4B]|uniref:Uncharacterized protein n=1 Tax=Halorhabdus tiamatea SARL4B TaxID=1033806 RepID=F7PLW4_9EURY|nr:hypothetical protein [Halorhabdus tiamatea]ERJ07392.1 hypothetical protein HLRTI_000434 [Halorhabdus tiamatea SARL4B]